MGGARGGGTAGYPYAVKDPGWTTRFTEVDPEFVIAVLDTGVTVDGITKKPHPFIAPNLMAGWEAYPDPMEGYVADGGYGVAAGGVVSGPIDGHGTFVAGRILREAPFATLAMRNPLDGPTPPPVLDNDHLIAEAIRDVASIPNLKLVNLGSYNVERKNQPPKVIDAALGDLFDAHPDVVVVTSLANNYRDEITWPAGFNDPKLFGSRVIAVGAVDETLTPYGKWRPPPKASFANWTGVDAWASGVNVLGPHLQQGVKLVTGEPAQGWVRWSGCPFATAAVTGMIARRMKHSELERTRLTPRQAFDRLIEGRPTIKVPGAGKAVRKPWLRETGSRWPDRR